MGRKVRKDRRNELILAIIGAAAVIIAAIIRIIPDVGDRLRLFQSIPGVTATPSSTTALTFVPTLKGTPTVIFTPFMETPTAIFTSVVTPVATSTPTPVPRILILKPEDFMGLSRAPSAAICGSKHETREEIVVPAGSTQLIVTIVIPWGRGEQGLHGPLGSGVDIVVAGDTKEERITEDNYKDVIERNGFKDHYLYLQGEEFSHTFDISGKAKVNFTIKIVGGQSACLDFQEARLEFR